MKWKIQLGRHEQPEEIPALARELGVGQAAVRVLWARGIRDRAAAHRFLQPTLADLHDPYLLADMDRAVPRLQRAIQSKEKILLYGDYDVDGTSSVVLLTTVIRLLGGDVSYHVPHRLKDGYGMRSEVVEDAAERGVSLIVSVDTGIRANAVVEHARVLGIDTIVTDHHLPETELPPAVAVLNPNRPDCGYPEKNLCGAGVAFKLASAMLRDCGWSSDKLERILDSFLKLVAIATVADVVPLTGENRVIVKRGLEGLHTVRNLGLRALLDVSGFPEGTAPSARDVAFRVAPRINAAGRMASASDVIEMFLTTEEATARSLASQLHELNADRQQTEAGIAEAITKLCLESPVTDANAGLVFAGEGWHRGVVGIVASRVVERYHRPVFVLGIENGIAQGSGRSIPAFHLLEALESMPDLFTKFGGHRQAAGLTLPGDRVEEFRARFEAYAAARLGPDDFERELEIDAEIDLREADDKSVMEILGLGPFGFGNAPPSFVIRNLKVAAAPDVKKEKHLFLRFQDGSRTLRAKAWNSAERAGELAQGTLIDAVVQFEDDAYSAARGYAPWQAIVRDFRKSAAAGGAI